MKLVVQRVTNASVEVEGEITGQIEEGLMVLVGFGQNDTEKEVDYLTRKVTKLRVFQDDEGKMNRSVQDIGGKLLLVPQFTLYGQTKKYRPSFHKALAPDQATKLFDYFVEKCSETVETETGIFGAYMKVSLLNDGPVTILLEKEFDEE
ncbi:D-aminoacyl-tRNA deacylase [uncultured Methanobrevibacter sp.]|uniref:D-aminoacyl-tRNA deacylase n=1 Tax=uncultured Methanobrevibacter sp. TaxID=253161 RepID=UPI0025D1105D|nr:D-aminoacyl-tRNA deacylase [uncultured Methanobrevibacter sp.]